MDFCQILKILNKYSSYCFNMNFTLKAKGEVSDDTDVQWERHVTVSQKRHTMKEKIEKINVGFKHESHIQSASKDDFDCGNWFMTLLLHTKATLAVPVFATARVNVWTESWQFPPANLELPDHKELTQWGQIHWPKYETSTEVGIYRIVVYGSCQFMLSEEPESSYWRSLLGKVEIFFYF